MSALPPYHVAAYNTAKASENKIHDDATATAIWFQGRTGGRSPCLRLHVAYAGAALGPRMA